MRGLPPKSPVYAVVNKINKKKVQQQQQSPQHCPQQPQQQQQQQQQLQQDQQQMYYSQQQQQPLIFQVNQQPQSHQIFQINQQQQQNQLQHPKQQLNHLQQQQQQLNPLQQQQQQTNGGVQYHNYCNIAPLLGDVMKQGENEYAQMMNPQTDLKNQESGCDNRSETGCDNGGHYYENTAAVLARLNGSEASTSNVIGVTSLNVGSMASSNVGGMGDYISMDPKMFSKTEMPLIPFEPLTYKFQGGEILPPPKYDSIDPIRLETCLVLQLMVHNRPFLIYLFAS